MAQVIVSRLYPHFFSEILCPTINAADAVLIDADEFTIGSLAKFTCKPGYKLVGNNQIVCGDDGIWEGVLPDCVGRIKHLY